MSIKLLIHCILCLLNYLSIYLSIYSSIHVYSIACLLIYISVRQLTFIQLLIHLFISPPMHFYSSTYPFITPLQQSHSIPQILLLNQRQPERIEKTTTKRNKTKQWKHNNKQTTKGKREGERESRKKNRIRKEEQPKGNQPRQESHIRDVKGTVKPGYGDEYN